MKQKFLIVNADDFGMSDAITDGILAAHHEGIVTSTSLMPNMPGTERAAALARSTPTLGVGIHLNITEGGPILPPEAIPTLVNGSGAFLSNIEMIPRIKRFRVNPFHIEAEFAAQCDRLLSLGILPSHLDTHHHVHIYPFSAWAFRRITERYRIRKARAARNYVVAQPETNGAGSRLAYVRKLAPIMTKNIYKLIMHKTIWRGIAAPRYNIGTPLRFFEPSAASVERNWVRLLRSLPYGVSEADCHPSSPGTDGPDNDPFADIRRYELEALTSSAVKEALRECGVSLISFRELP